MWTRIWTSTMSIASLRDQFEFRFETRLFLLTFFGGSTDRRKKKKKTILFLLFLFRCFFFNGFVVVLNFCCCFTHSIGARAHSSHRFDERSTMKIPWRFHYGSSKLRRRRSVFGVSNNNKSQFSTDGTDAHSIDLRNEKEIKIRNQTCQKKYYF